MTNQIDLHNKLAGEIVASIIKPVFDNGGSAEEVMVLTESVLAGVVLVLVKLGGDEIILDTMMEGVKERLADARLRHLPTQVRG